MKSSLKLLALGLLLLVPFATAHAQAPSLSPIPDITVNAGSTKSVNVVAVDVGGREITMTSSLPSFATLNTPLSGSGVVVTSLTLAPTSVNVGSYTVSVTATAGGVPDIQIFQIIVNATGFDQAPGVTAPALEEVTEGSPLAFTVSASDPDGDAITSLGNSALPTGASFTPNGSFTSGTFNWTPGSGDAGEYDVVFTAANALSGGAVTHIHVASAPTLAIVPIDDVTVADGSSISVPVSASGPAGVLITLTASLPSFATLNPPGSGTGAVNTTITVSPPTGSAGTYHASITATSDNGSVNEEFDIIVTGSGGNENHPPTLTAPATATVAIGASLVFDVNASDPDGDHVDLFGSALPPGSSFLDHGDNSGTFSWSPVSGQAGTYVASFSGLDNRGGSGAASTTITVTGDGGGGGENHPPTVSAPLTRTVDEEVNLSFTVSATDPDGDHVTLAADNVPFGAAFSDQGDNTALFSWTPTSTQSGVYDVAFDGDDGHGGTGTASTQLTVMDVNGGGGGGGELPGKACLIAGIAPCDTTTCFRLRPVNGSFALSDVELTSITLVYNGVSLGTLSGGAQIDVACGNDDDHDGDGHHGNGNHGNGHDCDDHQGKGHDCDGHVGNGHDCDGHVGNGHDCDGHVGNGHDCDGHVGNGHDCDGHVGDDHVGKGHDCDGQDCDGHVGKGHDCDGHVGNGHDCDDDSDQCNVVCDDDGGGREGGECDTLGIRACFSTEAVRSLFAGANLPCDLVSATLHATLTGGETVVATFGGDRSPGEDGDEKGKDKDKDKPKDKDIDKDNDNENHDGENRIASEEPSHHGMNPRVSPNPLNPQATLSFTISRPGMVRVAVYSMQGRMVKMLLEDFRGVGEQRLVWDGSDSRSQKVASGVYFFRIQAPEGEKIQRAVVVK